VGYFFNHDSPLRSERHIAKKISAAVRRISEGSTEIIEIGDTSVVKEWTFAGDVVEGIMRLVEQDGVYEANISSGMGYSISDWLEACFKVVDLDPAKYVREKNDFKPEYNRLVSDASLIRSLGFTQKISFEDLAKMMV
jgi:GDPmannose 4,6-dehydratase